MEDTKEWTLEETASENTQEDSSIVAPADEASASPLQPKFTKKKKLILGGIAAIAIIAIAVIILVARGSVFDRLVSEMLNEYPYADNARAADGSYLKIDTNPYDKDIDDMTYVDATLFYDIQSDSLDGIQFINKKLGFTDAVYTKMLETTALMGRQTEENNKYRVSWSYHPDKGLEVMYEKK